MAEQRCELTELLVNGCAHCRGHKLPEPEPLHWFRANYHGQCVNCGSPFKCGDQIAYTPDGYVCCTRELS